MNMGLDKARHDQAAIRVDDGPRPGLETADALDAPILNKNGAVFDQLVIRRWPYAGMLNEDIVCHCFSKRIT